MVEVLPAGDKIQDYDSRVDPDAPAPVAQVITHPPYFTSITLTLRIIESGCGNLHFNLFCDFHDQNDDPADVVLPFLEYFEFRSVVM